MRDWRGQVRGAGIRSPLAFAPPSSGRGRHGGFGSELEVDRVSKGLNGIGQDIEYASGEQDAQCVFMCCQAPCIVPGAGTYVRVYRRDVP